MNKWKFYNPGGMQDILKGNCYSKRETEEKLRQLYLSNGFMEIDTPVIEFYDVFAASGSETAMNSPFKMIDEKGRILTLRPDMTIPAARVASTKLKNEDLPAKFFYSGKCFRTAEYNGGQMREFTQSGAEIIGSGSLFYDGLMISTAVDAMKEIGLDEFTIELGQVDFFRVLMDLADFNEQDSEKIRLLIDLKDFFGVEEMLVDREMKSEVKALILNLPNLYGEKEMLLEVRGMTTDSRLLNVLNQLSELLEILDDFGVSEYISVDLGMVSRLDYYTGIIFRGMTYGMGFPILGGGRYDTLCGKFGKPMPATGFSLGVDRALTALYRNKGEIPEGYSADSIICFEENARKDAMMVAKALRGQGLRLEMYPIEKDIDDIKNYASAKGVKGIIFIKDSGEIEILDLKNDTAEKTDIKAITGGVS
ncbi:MAG: ATP phosphoribosyltransferase regulatory subunit [Clostridiales bacterium]|nr:ATP phosphoribosyltransferase regulatory subunit [Clostridiales bacterium]